MTPAVYRCVCGWSGDRPTTHPRQGFSVCPRCWPFTERVPQRTHDLKCWPEPYQAIVWGQKRHEIRKADRDFRVGDVLRLREWVPSPPTDNALARCTGRETEVRVTYVTEPGTWGLPADLCVLSIEVVR